MSLLDRPPAFLVGAQRSGTTWLQRMIAAHPRIVSGQESQLFSCYLAPLWQRWHEEDQTRGLGGRTTGLGCYLTRDQFTAQLRQFAATVFGSLEALKPAAMLVLEKSPDHGLHLPLIRHVYPQAPIIHLVRDGRDVVASLMAAQRQKWGKPWTPRTAREAAERWKVWVSKVRQDETEPFLEVRYEDLIADGLTVLDRVFEFLNLPLPLNEIEAIYHRYRFDACADGTAPESLVLNGDLAGTESQEPAGFFRQGKIGAWHEELSADEQKHVEQVAGRLLRELGYASREKASRLPWPGWMPELPRWMTALKKSSATTPHGEVGVRTVGHRDYVGGFWEEIGRLQFDFLVEQGLQPHHVLLDIGCGCLRGGVHFIAYLDPEHYLGIDKEASLIEAGLSRELPTQVRIDKRPRLLVSEDFAFAEFQTPVDFALAQSIFTHLPASLVMQCLDRLRPCLRPGGAFFATFHETDRLVVNPDRPHDHGYFAYTRGELAAIGQRRGWDAEYLGDWNHPRGQSMMRFRPRGTSGEGP